MQAFRTLHKIWDQQPRLANWRIFSRAEHVATHLHKPPLYAQNQYVIVQYVFGHPPSQCKPSTTKQLTQHVHLLSCCASNTTYPFPTHIFIWLIQSIRKTFFLIYCDVMGRVRINANKLVRQLPFSHCIQWGFSRNSYKFTFTNSGHLCRFLDRTESHNIHQLEIKTVAYKQTDQTSQAGFRSSTAKG